MIGYIKGVILHKDLRFLIINTGDKTGGVGYKVYTTPELISETEIDTHVNLWIHTVVKDDAIDLYGFKNKNSLDFFELLLSVSGIGPKSALNILGLANTSNIRQAVVSQDVAYLTNVSGISKKIAEKIVLELKGKILGGGDVESGDDISSTNRKTINIEVETLEALKALGYTQREAREALENVPRDIKETGDISIIIRATLKVLK